MSPHTLIIVPGLGDRKNVVEWAVSRWEKNYGILPVVHLMPWLGTEQSFEPKLQRLLSRIDEQIAKGHRVSLLGTSAGGCAVVNAFVKRKDKIHKVINVCGRLREGHNVFPSLRLAARNSPAFAESVRLCKGNLESLTPEDKNKMLVVKPIFDEVVPAKTVSIEGVETIIIPSILHVPSIALAMTVTSRLITDFIQEDQLT